MKKIKKYKMNNEIIYDFTKYKKSSKQKLYIDKISENGVVKGENNSYYKMFEIESMINFDIISEIVKAYKIKLSIYRLEDKHYYLMECTYTNMETAVNHFIEIENVLKHRLLEKNIEIIDIDIHRLFSILNSFYNLKVDESYNKQVELENVTNELFKYEYPENEEGFLKINSNVYEIIFIKNYAGIEKTKEVIKELRKHNSCIKSIRVEISYVSDSEYSNLVNFCYLDAEPQTKVVDDMYNFSYKTDLKDAASESNTDKYLLSVTIVLEDLTETELKSRLDALDITFKYANYTLNKCYIENLRRKIFQFIPFVSKCSTSYERMVNEEIVTSFFDFIVEAKEK